jgi:hypothetical protein
MLKMLGGGKLVMARRALLGIRRESRPPKCDCSWCAAM